MAEITVPEDLFRQLSEQARSMNRSVEEYVLPSLRMLDLHGEPLTEWKPLTDEVWEHEMEEWDRDIEARADRYPPGFLVDDSRELMYFGKDEAER